LATRQGLTPDPRSALPHLCVGPGTTEVTALIEDQDGIIWFVTRQPPQLQRIEDIAQVAVGGQIPAGLETIFQDRRGRPAARGRLGPLLREGGRWQRLAESPAGPIVAMDEDSSGRLWTANAAGQVQRFAPRLERTFDTSDGLPGARIERLHGARDGSLWVATHRGVYRIVGDRVEEVHLTDEPAWRYVRHVSEDADGVLWIGSRPWPHAGSWTANGSPLVRTRACPIRSSTPWSTTSRATSSSVPAGRLPRGQGRPRGRGGGRKGRVHATVFGRRGGIASSQAWGNTAVRARTDRCGSRRDGASPRSPPRGSTSRANPPRPSWSPSSSTNAGATSVPKR